MLIRHFGRRHPQITFILTYKYRKDYELNVRNLKVENVTQYEPLESNPMLLDLNDHIEKVTITNLEVNNVDSVQGYHGLMKIANSGSFSLQNATISNINRNAYLFDKIKYSYVPIVGGVFSFEHFASINYKTVIKYSFKDITIEGVYSQEGGAFYLAAEPGVSNFNDILVSLNNVTMADSHSYISGLFTVDSGNFDILIENSIFRNNFGVNGEADIRILYGSSMQVKGVLFKGANSNNKIIGTSITVSLTPPKTLVINFINVIFQCAEVQYSDEYFMALFDGEITHKELDAPILLYPGILNTVNCTFTKCVHSHNGGVILLKNKSVSVFEHFIKTEK